MYVLCPFWVGSIILLRGRKARCNPAFYDRKRVDYSKSNMDIHGLYLLLKGLQNYYKIPKLKHNLNLSQENHVKLCPYTFVGLKHYLFTNVFEFYYF